MATATQAPQSKFALVFGWILTLLAGLALIASAAMKFAKPPELLRGFADLGYPESLAMGLAIVELTSAVLYLFPPTSVLGAVLVTGYLGGATATHVRIGDPFLPPILLGVFAWGGLYFRDGRLRALLPLRRDPAVATAGVSVVKSIVVAIIALIAVGAVIVALQPAEFRVARSTTIAAPPADIFAHVNDFHKWPAWSPWDEMDPNAKHTYEGAPAGTGAVDNWSGEKTGAGRMTITDSRAPELLRMKVEFKRPFEGAVTAEFTFEPKGKETLVTWSMEGKNDDYVHKAFGLVFGVGNQFSQGLANLKAVVEKSARK